ncbi:MAG: hypothetical protein GF417_04845 [Candidatus Latescibacteria bacterium]|nr:hypothetical protein [bacterium]MBD3423748.1 hypothetical protein [Candidatus Latescibacterota bacterium]
MEPYTLVDYRRSHMLTRLLLSCTQGWYAMQNILRKTGDPGFSEEELTRLENLVNTAGSWNESLNPGAAPLLRYDGTVLIDGHSAELVVSLLFWLLERYRRMNNRLNRILNDPESLHQRSGDISYIIASLACAYYATNHIVQADMEFARRFDDKELAKARKGHDQQSQLELDFVEVILSSHLRGEAANSQSCSHLRGVIESVMDNQLKAAMTEIDKYLDILGGKNQDNRA